MYPWPIGDFDYAMDEALDIAMNYLERTKQAVKFIEVQRVAAAAIVVAWKMAARHRIKLAHVAIKAVEQRSKPVLYNYKRG
jgi:hypothetical protein